MAKRNRKEGSKMTQQYAEAMQEQENAKGMGDFKELAKEVAALPEEQRQKVAFFAQGVIAASAGTGGKA